jgi:hypothetical protein
VGNYWYHGHTAAYFEDEKQYQHARTECQGIIRPFYKPVVRKSFSILQHTK